MDEKNVVRVDNKPAAFYSAIVFIIVFTIGYFLYPQISMVIPFLGQNVTKNVGYEYRTVDVLAAQADKILEVTVTDVSKARVSGENVYREVSVTTQRVIKGDSIDKIYSFGGSALVKAEGSQKTKYNVTYVDEFQFEKNKTYIVFLNFDGTETDGKYGVFTKNDDGTYVSENGKIFDFVDFGKL